MHPNARTIETFYESFRRRDAAGMVACYAPDVTFSDPVFPLLRGPEVARMWRMLAERATTLELTFGDVRATDDEGGARWEARYIFSATGRPVHNVVEARFAFVAGKIVRHEDAFDLWRWCGMALGPAGKLLGWSPPFRAAVRKKAAANLALRPAGAERA
jgi:ketosteroid isomerase-like protein